MNAKRLQHSKPSRSLLAAALAGACLLAAGQSAQAGEGLIIAGTGDHTDTIGLAYHTDPWKTWNFQGGGSMIVYGEAEIANWHGKEAQLAGTETNRNITEIGFKPVLRYMPIESSSFRPYIEVGLGVHLLSHTAINQVRRLPTAFEFGEILGVGAEFCDKLACSLSARVQHVSNAGLKQPNNGITFTAVTFGYKF